ncbi:hypothetical protein [Martelella mediterranea]|uniref:Uncharacterized protein n=1 Tax=Martelella mediterranea TaxID=293089 RepID=A0A4R3NDD9_9HYPH|nr:hypothetical protein [Martelella mediterranea]TCT29257.1 hypothetical protein EDC90_10524 [Martelella mediterranea]
MDHSVPLKMLLMLSVCSLRCGFLRKAVVYTRIGMVLFPSDERFREMAAYGLLLLGENERCRDALDGMSKTSRNQAYLEARLQLASEKTAPEVSERLRDYLRAEQ